MTRKQREHRIATLIMEIKQYRLDSSEFYWDFDKRAFDYTCNRIDNSDLNSFEKRALKILYHELLDSSNTLSTD